MQILPDKNVLCPYHRKPCRAIVCKYVCPKYEAIPMRNDQTGEVSDVHGCMDTHLKVLLMEAGRQTSQAGAAIESFRNEMVQANNNAMHLTALSANLQKLGDAIQNTERNKSLEESSDE